MLGSNPKPLTLVERLGNICKFVRPDPESTRALKTASRKKRRPQKVLMLMEQLCLQTLIEERALREIPLSTSPKMEGSWKVRRLTYVVMGVAPTIVRHGGAFRVTLSIFIRPGWQRFIPRLAREWKPVTSDRSCLWCLLRQKTVNTVRVRKFEVAASLSTSPN